MKLSQETFYGLDAMSVLAHHDSSRPVSVEEIARSRNLPRNFLAKILQKLVRGGLVLSSRGRQRGYALAVPAGQITVREILEVTEGGDPFRRCLFWPRRCSEGSPCRLHDIGRPARAQLEERLRALTLADLAGKERGMAGDLDRYD